MANIDTSRSVRMMVNKEVSQSIRILINNLNSLLSNVEYIYPEDLEAYIRDLEMIKGKLEERDQPSKALEDVQKIASMITEDPNIVEELTASASPGEIPHFDG